MKNRVYKAPEPNRLQKLRNAEEHDLKRKNQTRFKKPHVRDLPPHARAIIYPNNAKS